MDISTWLEGIYTEAGSLVGQLIVLGFSIYRTYIFQFGKMLCPHPRVLAVGLLCLLTTQEAGSGRGGVTGFPRKTVFQLGGPICSQLPQPQVAGTCVSSGLLMWAWGTPPEATPGAKVEEVRATEGP